MVRKLLIFSFVAGIALVAAFFYVDARVGDRLERRTAQTIPSIYSDLVRISPRTPLTPEALRNQLLSRRYRESASTPKVPGEFRIAGGIAEIVTRDFRAPDGTTLASTSIRYDFERRSIQNAQEPDHDYFYLEPQIISHLGSGELRADSDKRLEEIPAFVGKAVMAIEDERFYEHHGIDVTGVLRAMLQNLRALRFVQGGSTLTQQLAKNILLSPEKTFGRKFMEALSAISLERRLTKPKILEMYLNEVYLGQEGDVAIHGIAEASSTFFAKKVNQITISEAALLAGIIKAPSYFSPRRHLDRALERRNTVLDKMAELKFITPAEAEKAKHATVTIVGETQHRRVAPHFMTALNKELSAEVNLDAAIVAGYNVYTGLDLDMQRCAEDAVERGLANLEKKYPRLTKKGEPFEAALVAIEPFSGLVKAWVGGRDFSRNQFDHGAQAKRQLGSTVKPFLYLTALDGRLNTYKVASPVSILSDRPMKINLVSQNSWVPENYDHKYRGDVTLRYALENSLNLPAVYVAERVGIGNLVRTMRAFKIGEDFQAVPSLALGSAETSLFKLTAAYGALANGGIYVPPRLFLTVVNSDGERVAGTAVAEERVADENAVYVLTNIMQGVIDRGTAKSVRTLGFTADAAGKTGTSNDTRDAWFMGFTPDLVAGVWTGFDNNEKIGLTGGASAAPIWTEFMKCVAPFHEQLPFVPPPGVSFVDVDMVTRERATPDCPPSDVVKEVFVHGTEPPSLCRLHGRGERGTAEEPFAGEGTPRRRERSIWDRLFGG